jgi:hypothetical protein
MPVPRELRELLTNAYTGVASISDLVRNSDAGKAFFTMKNGQVLVITNEKPTDTWLRDMTAFSASVAEESAAKEDHAILAWYCGIYTNPGKRMVMMESLVAQAIHLGDLLPKHAPATNLPDLIDDFVDLVHTLLQKRTVTCVLDFVAEYEENTMTYLVQELRRLLPRDKAQFPLKLLITNPHPGLAHRFREEDIVQLETIEDEDEAEALPAEESKRRDSFR